MLLLLIGCRTPGGRDIAGPDVIGDMSPNAAVSEKAESQVPPPRYVARTTQPSRAGTDTTVTMRSGSGSSDSCPPPPPYSQ